MSGHIVPLLLVLLGLAAGFISGLIGIGGGSIMIPFLVLVLGMSQHEAQGTTLAIMIPPIGLLAAWTYYKAGYVNIKMAIFVALGFFIGGLLGAALAVRVPDQLLRKIFAVALLGIALKMFFS